MMRKKTAVLLVLLVLAVSLPAQAIDSRDLTDYAASPMAIAWRSGDTIYVAVVNEFTSRDVYRIEIYNTQSRSPLASREVLVPGKCILIEAFEPRDIKSSAFPITEVMIYKGYFSRTIKIQEQAVFLTNDFLVPANTSFAVEVDLESFMRGTSRGRIVVDDEFTMFYNRSGGRISVTYEPGLDYYHSNIIEYRPPRLILTMRAPYVRDVDLLSFEIRHRPAGSWRDEYMMGPVLMVYGRDYTVLDNTKGGTSGSSSGGSGSFGSGWQERK